MDIGICKHGHSVSAAILANLPPSQASAGRHKCTNCAYDLGFNLTSYTGEIIECEHKRKAPVKAITSLPDSQAGKGRHKCAICAFSLGVDAANRGELPIVEVEVQKFIVGQDYSRKKDIHEVYGGNAQSGISTPAGSPFIFLFTGGSGAAHGYSDYKTDDVFNYYGEGQLDDMTMTGGNKAILNHKDNGKTLLLFESLGKGKPVRYLGEYYFTTYETVQAPDRLSNMRKAFVFKLAQTDAPNDETEVTAQDLNQSLAELRQKAYQAAATPLIGNKKQRTVELKIRRGDVKKYALKRANGICECCGIQAPFISRRGVPFLEVHHMKMLSDNGIDSPENVAAVTPNCHRRIHQGQDGKDIDVQLTNNIRRKEKLV